MDFLGDGIYVCDRERRIVFWNKSAERITGWQAEDVIGRACLDDVLNHVDKDGRRLCGKEYVPLHRSMVTGDESDREGMNSWAVAKYTRQNNNMVLMVIKCPT